MPNVWEADAERVENRCQRRVKSGTNVYEMETCLRSAPRNRSPRYSLPNWQYMGYGTPKPLYKTGATPSNL